MYIPQLITFKKKLGSHLFKIYIQVNGCIIYHSKSLPIMVYFGFINLVSFY